jgi:hypothetical protein
MIGVDAYCLASDLARPSGTEKERCLHISMSCLDIGKPREVFLRKDSFPITFEDQIIKGLNQKY